MSICLNQNGLWLAIRAANTQDAVVTRFAVHVVVKLVKQTRRFTRTELRKVPNVTTGQPGNDAQRGHVRVLRCSQVGVDTNTIFNTFLCQILVSFASRVRELLFLVCIVERFVITGAQKIGTVVGQAGLEYVEATTCVLQCHHTSQDSRGVHGLHVGCIFVQIGQIFQQCYDNMA